MNGEITLNRGNKLVELKPCPKCGMDGGIRKMTEDGLKYAIVCDYCGYRTKLHPNQPSATYEWNKRKEK